MSLAKLREFHQRVIFVSSPHIEVFKPAPFDFGYDMIESYYFLILRISWLYMRNLEDCTTAVRQEEQLGGPLRDQR